jgi:hypothetical protein
MKPVHDGLFSWENRAMQASAHRRAARCAAALLLAMAASARAADAADAPACMEVVVNGERVPAYDCLQRQLQPRPAVPRAGAPGEPAGAEAIVQRPSNQLGVFNRAATQTRMGNTFGTSVLPQRPTAPP